MRKVNSGRGYGHTKFDTVDKVTIRGLRDASALAAQIVLRVARAEPWLASPRDADAVEKLLNQPQRTEIQAFLQKIDEYFANI